MLLHPTSIVTIKLTMQEPAGARRSKRCRLEPMVGPRRAQSEEERVPCHQQTLASLKGTSSEKGKWTWIDAHGSGALDRNISKVGGIDSRTPYLCGHRLPFGAAKAPTCLQH